MANTTDQLFLAEYAIGEINNIIQKSLLDTRAKGVPYNKSRVVFGSCQRLRVQNIANVKTRKMPDGTATTMDVRVQSSNHVNQVEIITVQVRLRKLPFFMKLVVGNLVLSSSLLWLCLNEYKA